MRWKFLIQYSHSLWKLLCVINLLIASTLSNQDNLPMGMKVRASKCSQLCEPWFLKLFLYWISETILVSLSYVKAKCSDSYLPQEPEWVTHCVSWDSHSSDPSVCLCFTSCRRNESQPKSLFKKIYIFLLALQSFQMEAIITWQKSLWMSVFPLHNPKCMVGLEGLCSSSLPRPQRSDRRSLSPHQPSRSKCAKDNKRNPRTASSKTSPQHFSPFSTKIYFLLDYFHMKLTYFLLKHSPNAGTWEGFGVTIALVRSHQALGRAPQTPAHSWLIKKTPIILNHTPNSKVAKSSFLVCYLHQKEGVFHSIWELDTLKTLWPCVLWIHLPFLPSWLQLGLCWPKRVGSCHSSPQFNSFWLIQL